ncbi:MAG: dihydroorotase [Planctomycetota bacterium]
MSRRSNDVTGADLVVVGGDVVSEYGVHRADVWIQAGLVRMVGADVARLAPTGTAQLDAAGKLVFPGLIDPQVHFREPGLEHKEDLASGGLCAIAGGMTGFLEMPNTNPLTTDPERLADKLERASGRSPADFGFFIGGTAENADRLGEWETLPGCAGVKVFMGSSTGNLLIPDDATLERVLRSGKRRVTVHSEDDPRLKERYAAIGPDVHVREHPHIRDVECAMRATRRLLALAEKTGRPVHLLHVSTAEEIELVRERALGDLVTVEVTPNHLFLAAPDCYEEHGTWAQMNPPVRDRRHQATLRQAVADGTATCIGSDHAPHTAAEKAKPFPVAPSGIAGTQTILPLLLTAVRDGWLRLPDIVRLCLTGPCHVYGIQGRGPLAPGVEGDLVLVDPTRRGPLPVEALHSRAGFSPFVGVELAGWPCATVLRGEVVYRVTGQDGLRGAAVGAPTGRALRFLA